MPQDVTMKQLRIVTAVCAFSLSIAQVNAEDQLLVDEGMRVLRETLGVIV
jgi:hypothetical protein